MLPSRTCICSQQEASRVVMSPVHVYLVYQVYIHTCVIQVLGVPGVLINYFFQYTLVTILLFSVYCRSNHTQPSQRPVTPILVLENLTDFCWIFNRFLFCTMVQLFARPELFLKVLLVTPTEELSAHNLQGTPVN
jgi:hypothetical protein